jgi:predicted 2-oxoglutarate/Fe(II)-dependent dioxygenase YbiX
VDDAPEVPRTLSMIFLLNDDYEGGELTLYDPESNPLFSLPVKKNQLIVWPSNFMFPHGVAPVKKGTRYSIVSWIR